MSNLLQHFPHFACMSPDEVRDIIQTWWQYYYWNDTKTNPEGESLQTCMTKYGVGGWYSPEKDMIYACIFMSEVKGHPWENNWLLGIKHFSGDQGNVTLYENEGTNYHLSPSSPLGAQITSLLDESREFEEV
jgi:hypothetical protein